MNIVIYGTGNKSSRLMDRIGNNDKIHIAGFIETHKSKDSFYGIKVYELSELEMIESFDYIVVATLHYEEIVWDLYMAYGEKYRRKAVYYVDFLEDIVSTSIFAPYYSSISGEGLSFIYDSRDQVIGPWMRSTGKVFSSMDIDAFVKLAKEYYGFYEDKTCFVDIGANIGTTSIYIKEYHPSWRILSVEPSVENYRMLRANCILNGMDDIECVNLGLSDEEGMSRYSYVPRNPGESCIIQIEGNDDSDNQGRRQIDDVGSKVSITTLDALFEEKSLNTNSNVLVWMDTEGFEAKIIRGGMKTLATNKLPLFQEFNPRDYKNSGDWEQYKKDIESLYTRFIDCDEYIYGKKETISTKDIDEYANKVEKSRLGYTNLFFIK